MDATPRMASSGEGAEFPPPLPVQNGLGHDRAGRISGAEKQDIERRVVGRLGHGLFPAWLTLRRWWATVRAPQQAEEIANVGMAVAAVLDQECNQRAHPFHIGAINDRAAVACAAHQARSGQDAEMT